MDQTPLFCSIQCPDHQSEKIVFLNIDPNAQKLGHCNQCITKTYGGTTLPKTIKNFMEYVEETSSFNQKCQQNVQSAGTPPCEYLEMLEKEREQIDKLTEHVKEEKRKIEEIFDEIKKSAVSIIDLKKEEYLQLLNAEISSLSDLYRQSKKLITSSWSTNFSHIEETYPTSETLKERMSQICDLDQLQAFVKGVSEDQRFENIYCDERDGLERRKQKINRFRTYCQNIGSSFPKLQGQLLKLENVENQMKSFLSSFSQQQVQVENSIALKMKEISEESNIIGNEQYEVLKSWIPNSDNLRLKLLYRASIDGPSPQIFHKNCDEKGATVSLIKCKSSGASTSSVIGGFLDQSWHSRNTYTYSYGAFLFSLTPGATPTKYPLLGSGRERAFYGHRTSGLRFGGGHDLQTDDFKAGTITQNSYSNANALRVNNQNQFTVEEVEIFQVL